MDELVAELGSAFLCADLQITPEVRDDQLFLRCSSGTAMREGGGQLK